MSESDAGSRVADRLRDTGPRHWEALFLGSIFAYVLVLVITARGYAPDPRLFPLLIGVPLLGLILLRVTMLLSDRFDVAAVGMFDQVTADLDDVDEDHDDGSVDDVIRYRRQVESIVWLCSLVALIWALGFQIGLVIFVFTFVYTYERDVVRAAGATVAAYAIVYLLFVRLLSVQLFEPALLPDSIVELLPATLSAVAGLAGVAG